MTKKASATNILTYEGEVIISREYNKKKYQVKKFNDGPRYLSDLFTSAILGLTLQSSTSSASYPTQICLGYFTRDLNDDVEFSNPDISSFVSMMAMPQVLTGKTYVVSQNLSTLNWKFPKFDTIIYKNTFVEQSSSGSTIYACLEDRNGHIIAMVDTGCTEVTGGETSLFGDSTNILINWTMKIFNAPSETTDATTSGEFQSGGGGD